MSYISETPHIPREHPKYLKEKSKEAFNSTMIASRVPGEKHVLSPIIDECYRTRKQVAKYGKLKTPQSDHTQSVPRPPTFVNNRVKRAIIKVRQVEDIHGHIYKIQSRAHAPCHDNRLQRYLHYKHLENQPNFSIVWIHFN